MSEENVKHLSHIGGSKEEREGKSQFKRTSYMFYLVVSENIFLVTAANMNLVCFLASESGVRTYFVPGLE